MPSKYDSPRRFMQPDPRYQSLLVEKFCNCMMRDGKKRTAYRVFYDAMDEIQNRMKDKDPLDVFTQAVQNVKPLIQVRSRRVGGATYQVPMEVKRRRATSLAIRWLLEATRKKKGRPMHKRLADELIMAYRREGTAMATRDNVHKMAEANKAFAHLSW
ncbi:MAG: 30S ribosomal protein S7 [Planctomycetota bacterium]|nr:MAG: 30S ribosomal protein S7 [Planctomycetota bacterium]